MVYDAQNHLKSVALDNVTGTNTYAYDADGRRVRKTLHSGASKRYVYNAQGQLMAEYAAPNTLLKEYIYLGSRLLAIELVPEGARFMTGDHLGSTRLVTDASGSVISRHDYLPFGKELPATVGGRSAVGGYGADDHRITQRFTGKEVDPETGLQYFGARYYSGRQGRFTTPDALLAKKEWLPDPQRWNRYAYVRNNPLRFFDPNGEDLVIYTFYAQDLTEEQKRYLEANMRQIQAAIAEKFRKAGMEKVEFRDARSLSQKQIDAIQKDAPAGVALLGFANESFAGKSLDGAKGATDRPMATSVVSLKNIAEGSLINPPSRDYATTTFRTGEVASHELGHAVGFESNAYINYLTAGMADFFRSNIMDEKQGVPTRSKFFDTGSDRNKRVIEEINRIGDNTPKP